MNVPAGHPEETPLIFFGAFDRHNLGDLLLGKVAQALRFPRPVVFAGLAARDLTLLGGGRTADRQVGPRVGWKACRYRACRRRDIDVLVVRGGSDAAIGEERANRHFPS